MVKYLYFCSYFSSTCQACELDVLYVVAFKFKVVFYILVLTYKLAVCLCAYYVLKGFT